MKILIIDGQGGRIGKQLIESLHSSLPNCELIAVGTNSIATSTMLKAGAANAATGENAVHVNASKADVITGPVGIAIADALMGEITPAMAASVAQSEAVKVLIPMNKCGTVIAGITDLPLSELIADAVKKIAGIIN